MSTYHAEIAPRQVWRLVRAPLAVVLALLAVTVLGFLVSERATVGAYDPEAVDERGSRAVASLLRGYDVEVTRVAAAAEVAAAAGEDAVVFVPIPDRLRPADLRRLVAESAGAAIVVVAPTEEALDALAPGVTVADDSEPVAGRQPACPLPLARRAGVADMGGTTYRAGDGAEPVECYATGGAPSLLRVGRTTVVGAGDIFTNERLDERGNAALALGLLGTGDRVVWVLPRVDELPVDEDQGLVDLLPDRVWYVTGALAAAAILFAGWRGRRLGPVVTEPLPVVVRAAETVEGRARLYQAASARERAADALRSGRRDALAARLGLGRGDDRTALVTKVAERTGRPAADIDALLYGHAPGDERTLVRLADDLDTLDAEVRRR